MQKVYAAYYPAGHNRQQSTFFKRSKNRDYLIRSEKRSPYDTGSIERPTPGGKKGGKMPRRKRGILYMCITILTLVVAYPVGLFLLWARRLKWRLAPKMLVTAITACAFCLLAIYVINADTGNAKISAMQKDARAALLSVNDYTGEWVDGALGWFKGVYAKGEDNALLIWDAVKKPMAKEALALYDQIDSNLRAMKVDLPNVLLAEYKARIDYKEPAPTRKPQPDTQPAPVTVNSGSPNTAYTQSGEARPSTQSEPETGAATPGEAARAPEDTVTAPITLPYIKEASLAPVYFTPNGVRYHMTENCSGMMNAVSHTLKEADEANKQICDACGTPPVSMIDCDAYLWIDKTDTAHTTDECSEFEGMLYELLPFEEVYRGRFSYCEACGGDICEEYILNNFMTFVTDGASLDENTRKLYDYEKQLTVYYLANYRYYHADMRCDSFMTGDFVHSLYDALHVDMLSPCVKCEPLTEEDLLESGAHLPNPA